MFTQEQVESKYPAARNCIISKYLPAINAAIEEFGIQDGEQFLDKIMKDSAHLTYMAESFNFSAEYLTKNFPKQFSDITLARLYEYKQQKIAIRVYSGKFGNANEPRPDGWTYRGRGFFKITGKDKYYTCGKAIKRDLLADPDYLLSPEGAARSAAWVWSNG